MVYFRQLFLYMAGRIPCTCGCGLEVTYTTKRNHLNGLGKTYLRATIMKEVKSLKRVTRQQLEPTPPLQRGLRKRASSNPDQDGSRKQRKVAQIREDQLPEVTADSQPDTDLVEDLLPPVMANTDWESRFVERSWSVMEMRWAASRRDSGFYSDGKGRDNDDRDEEEGGDGDEEDKDREDEDDEDGDKDKDKDKDKDSFYESEIPGISHWDLLAEDFEREAAALGLFSSSEFPTQLTIL